MSYTLEPGDIDRHGNHYPQEAEMKEAEENLAKSQNIDMSELINRLLNTSESQT